MMSSSQLAGARAVYGLNFKAPLQDPSEISEIIPILLDPLLNTRPLTLEVSRLMVDRYRLVSAIEIAEGLNPVEEPRRTLCDLLLCGLLRLSGATLRDYEIWHGLLDSQSAWAPELFLNATHPFATASTVEL